MFVYYAHVIERSNRRFSARRLITVAGALLDAAPLCAIATVDERGRAYVNTAYFAWSPAFDIVWISAPDAAHSRHVASRPSAAVAVHDSHQTWGRPDRGIQLFGTAGILSGAAAEEAERVYAERFRDYETRNLRAYRVYRLRPQRVKLFDERALGSSVFVTAAVRRGSLEWRRTDVYRSDV